MDINDITVIIPTKDEAKNIVSFLESLPAEIALIIVDSGTDRTAESTLKFKPQKTKVISEVCNIPQARQLGADTAATEWLLFSDADMAFDSQYFKNLQNMQFDNKTGAVMGGKHSKKKFRWYYNIYTFSIMFLAWFKIPIGSGSNMLIRKEALQSVGGFDLALSHSEDNDILWRIHKAGWKVVFKKSLRVYETDHRRLEKGIFKKFSHGTLRAFFLITGFNREKVRKSDWGYWDK
jgi:GT2 family glycosyltransferase